MARPQLGKVKPGARSSIRFSHWVTVVESSPGMEGRASILSEAHWYTAPSTWPYVLCSMWQHLSSVGLFLKKSILFKRVFERQNKRERDAYVQRSQLPSVDLLSKHWARLKPGVKNSIRVSHMGSRNSHLLRPRHVSRKLKWEWRQDLLPDILKWVQTSQEQFKLQYHNFCSYVILF